MPRTPLKLHVAALPSGWIGSALEFMPGASLIDLKSTAIALTPADIPAVIKSMKAVPSVNLLEVHGGWLVTASGQGGFTPDCVPGLFIANNDEELVTHIETLCSNEQPIAALLQEASDLCDEMERSQS